MGDTTKAKGRGLRYNVTEHDIVDAKARKIGPAGREWPNLSPTKAKVTAEDVARRHKIARVAVADGSEPPVFIGPWWNLKAQALADGLRLDGRTPLEVVVSSLQPEFYSVSLTTGLWPDCEVES